MVWLNALFSLITPKFATTIMSLAWTLDSFFEPHPLFREKIKLNIYLYLLYTAKYLSERFHAGKSLRFYGA